MKQLLHTVCSDSRENNGISNQLAAPPPCALSKIQGDCPPSICRWNCPYVSFRLRPQNLEFSTRLILNISSKQDASGRPSMGGGATRDSDNPLHLTQNASPPTQPLLSVHAPPLLRAAPRRLTSPAADTDGQTGETTKINKKMKTAGTNTWEPQRHRRHERRRTRARRPTNAS